VFLEIVRYSSQHTLTTTVNRLNYDTPQELRLICRLSWLVEKATSMTGPGWWRWW